MMMRKLVRPNDKMTRQDNDENERGENESYLSLRASENQRQMKKRRNLPVKVQVHVVLPPKTIRWIVNSTTFI